MNRAVEVHLQHSVEPVDRERPLPADELRRPDDPRGGDDDVHETETADGRVDRPPHALVVGDVGREEGAPLRQLGRQGSTPVLVDVENGHPARAESDEAATRRLS
jgi:hypothetical protein